MNLRKLFSLLVMVAFVCGIADARMSRMKKTKMTGMECVPCNVNEAPVSEFFCSKICRTRELKPSDQPVIVANDPSGRIYYCNESDYKNYETAENRLRQQMEMHGDMMNIMDLPA